MTEPAVSPSSQLPLSIAMDDGATFDNFFVSEVTQAAVAALASCLEAPDTGLYLWGVSGVGKSHLLQAACQSGCFDALYLPLNELIDYPPEQVTDGCERAPLLAIDGLDAVIDRPAWHEALFHLFNRQRESGGTLLFAGRQAPAAYSELLPDLRSRLSSLPVYQLPKLSEEDLGLLLRFRAKRRGLIMSEDVINYILARAPRSTPALLDLLDVLDRETLARARGVTIPLINELRLLSRDR